MKEVFKTVVICLGIIVICLALIVAATSYDNYEAERTYNHGICTECGGHYKFISSATSRGISRTNRYYYYKCDRCDKIIEISK